jgi:uncharacterized protein YjiS (DUF1127 family)
MTTFQLNITQFPELIFVHFLRWTRHYTRTELENLSDRSLEDIGLDPSRPDLDTVKPFWMPWAEIAGAMKLWISRSCLAFCSDERAGEPRKNIWV